MAAERDSAPSGPAADRHEESWGIEPGTPDQLAGPGSPPDERPLTPPAVPPPARVERVVVPRWIQAVMLPLALLALFALAHAARSVVLIFLIAAVIALVVNPLVSLLGRARFPRGLAVLTVYLGFLACLVGVGALLVSPVTAQVKNFQRDVPAIVKSGNDSLAKVQSWLDKNHIGVKVQGQGQTALQTVEKNVVRGSGSIVKFTTGLVQSLAQAAFSLILVIVVSVYMLIYSDRIGRIVRRVMPRGDGSPEDDYPLRVQKAVFGYVRGQVTFSALMGISAGVGLWVFGLVGLFSDGGRYALFFGLFYALMEFVPFVGPVLGALPPILVALFENPVTAIWVVLLFLALQQLEGHVVAPQVFGHSLRINPLLIIMTLLGGGELYGVVGALISLPIAAVMRETAVYLSRHVVLEPWGTLSPAAAEAGQAPGPPATSSARAVPPAETPDRPVGRS
ncbi:MAG: AI-2E family transporter [Thermoleophilaceae bacterium]